MNKLNLLELLKGVPSGTPLYCRLCGEVTFDGIENYVDFPIGVTTETGEYLDFTKYGAFFDEYDTAECMLFPDETCDWNVPIKTAEKNPTNKDFVDLGLSVKWATCNVGANTPEEYGDYLTFDETIEKFNNKDVERIPTILELDELDRKCKWEWTNINDHNGYKITGPNGNSIFLPAAGWRNEIMFNSVGMCGYYWSSSLISSRSYVARYLGFYDRFHGTYYSGRKCVHSVRLVKE